MVHWLLQKKRYQPGTYRRRGRIWSWLLIGLAGAVLGMEVAVPVVAELFEPRTSGLLIVALTIAGFGVRVWMQNRESDDDDET